MKYAVCIDALFPGRPAAESLTASAAAGFPAIEFWGWWDKDLALMKTECEKRKLDVAAFCTDIRIEPGDPSNHEAYLQGVKASLAEAARLGCRSLIVQAGWEANGHVPGGNTHQPGARCVQSVYDREGHRKALTRALEGALPFAEAQGVTLLLEPLNIKVDHPGYHMWESGDAFSFVSQFQSPYLKILFDIYHQQITEGNILQTITAHIGQIGHFHIAAVPGRMEPWAGELNYPLVLEQIDRLGYEGYVGLEYMPKGDAAETLRECAGYLPGFG